MSKMKLKALGKVAVSGIIAFAILTGFCFFYCNTPVITGASKDEPTDYTLEANTFYSLGTEGFSWGKTNNEGFTNMFDYEDGMRIDVLIMGSSHMEAHQVDMSQSTAGRLNALLENETVYNIGVSSHSFVTCASNFRAALNKYQPTKYVVIETGKVSFTDEAIALAINEETAELYTMDQSVIIASLKKNPYLRLLYSQMKDYKTFRAGVESDTAFSENLLADLLQKLRLLAEEYGAKVIIVYHPELNIAPDGALDIIADQNAVALFKKSCDDHEILFLDMSNRFKEEYESAYILPYGFCNSPVGTGHLNKYGHAMIADELYNLILEDEQ